LQQILGKVDEVVVPLGHCFFAIDSHLFDEMVDRVDLQLREVEMLEEEVELSKAIILVGVKYDVEIVGRVSRPDKSCSKLSCSLVQTHMINLLMIKYQHHVLMTSHQWW
jgi:hypothetical protein